MINTSEPNKHWLRHSKLNKGYSQAYGDHKDPISLFLFVKIIKLGILLVQLLFIKSTTDFGGRSANCWINLGPCLTYIHTFYYMYYMRYIHNTEPGDLRNPHG
jgi:hypothetical protein